MDIKSYVGITGFTEPEQVVLTIRMLREVDFPSSHQLMVAVLASPKSLRGEPLRPMWQNKYPPKDRLERLFFSDPRTFNVIHYNSKEPGLADQLAELVLLAPLVEGIQLNIKWPDPEELLWFKAAYPRVRLILQVGAGALDEIGFDPVEPGSATLLHDRLIPYARAGVEYWLLDRSGGLGRPLDHEYSLQTLAGQMIWSDIRMAEAVAGGLSGENVAQVLSGLIRNCPWLSWDAENSLRTDDDQLDLDKCFRYLEASAALIKQVTAEHIARWGKPPAFL